MQSLAERVAEHIHKYKLLKAGDRVGAAVSGGADSVAMLRLLLELRQPLGIVLLVVHFNHKLRGVESDGDEQFVAALARRHELEFIRGSGNVAKVAEQKKHSVEAVAREMRYAFFQQLLREGRVNRLGTGHTLDDQAETVLLRLSRGAGTRGLAGVYPELEVGVPGAGKIGVVAGRAELAIVRPLLGVRREELERYLVENEQDWREDASNRELRYARNRVRHGIVPRLERELNPAIREVLAETADIARGEEEYWQKEVAEKLPACWNADRHGLFAASLGQLPLALRRRVVRASAKSVGLSLEFHHVEEILAVWGGEAKSANLPEGWIALREGAEVQLLEAKADLAAEYEYRLMVPGSVAVPELGTRFTAARVGETPGGSPGREELTVRNWRPGDHFWPQHRKSAKKIKELLQEKHLPGRERKLWPVVVRGEEVIWVRGFGAARARAPEIEEKTVFEIREEPLHQPAVS